MKGKALILYAAALAALLSGCQKQERLEEPEFRAVMESVQDDSPATKTAIDGSAINWVTDDRIRINDVEYKALSGGSTSADFERVGSVAPAGSTYKAVYPCDGSSCSEGTVTLAASISDPLTGSGFPMYAESTDGTLAFKNLCGLVCLNLKTTCGTATVSSIKLEDSSLGMSGTCDIVSAGTGIWKAVPKSAGTSVTLTCSRDINASTAESFTLCVPPASYGALKITVTTDKGTVTRTSNKAIEVVRSSTTTISLDLGFATGHDYVDLGLPSGLLWATKNVGASSETDVSDATKFTWAAATSTAVSSWGGAWRLPTKADLEELTKETYMHWTGSGYYFYKAKMDSDKGLKDDSSRDSYYSDSDTRIFLPAAFTSNAYGYYWSSDEKDSGNAYCLYFYSGEMWPEGYESRDKTYKANVRLVLKL